MFLTSVSMASKAELLLLFEGVVSYLAQSL